MLRMGIAAGRSPPGHRRDLPGGGCLLAGWAAVWAWTGPAASARSDHRGPLELGGGLLGQGEDVPGDVGAGDGLYGDPVADLNVPGERAIGQLDGPRRIPLEPAGGEFGFHRLEVFPDAAEVGDHHGAEE